MTLTVPRILAVTALAAGIELAGFQWRYRDLVYLSRPATAVAADPAAAVDAQLQSALSRPRLSRTVLEHMTSIASERHDRATAITTLRRMVQNTPRDQHLRLRLAEALREDGRLGEARRYYRELIDEGETTE